MCSGVSPRMKRSMSRGSSPLIARSAAPIKPRSPTWAASGNTSARSRTRRAARFSSNRSRVCSASWDAHNTALAFGGERQAGADVVDRQLRKIAKDLFFAHPGCEIRQDVTDRDARSAHTRLPEANLRIDADSVSVIHGPNDRAAAAGGQGPRPPVFFGAQPSLLTARAAPGRKPAGGAGCGSRRVWRRSAWSPRPAGRRRRSGTSACRSAPRRVPSAASPGSWPAE